jgi:hypothetical protein
MKWHNIIPQTLELNMHGVKYAHCKSQMVITAKKKGIGNMVILR